MADDDNLRFVMELKDEFSEIFNKISETVHSEVPKLRADIGGLGKALAVVGGAAAIGGIVYGAWTMLRNKISDVTKEAEALQATLGNILGSKGAAKSVLEELANSDLSKVFKIREIDEGYMTLANHGLKATMAQMKAIGDLSAGTGRSFSSVIDAIVRGGEGRLLTIKQLGIDVTANKNKKAGIDNLTLSFRGQTQTIKNNAGAIREYLMNLGMIPGVQGSMARSADTVAASENSLSNQVTRLWKNLAEKLNPATVESKVELSKFVGKIADFFAIPMEDKLQKQVDKLETLKVQLSETTPKTKDWYDILQDIKDINPDILKGLDLEKTSFENIAAAIDKGSDALVRQKSLVLLNKDNADLLGSIADAKVKDENSKAAIANLIARIDPSIANHQGSIFMQAQDALDVINKKIATLPNSGKQQITTQTPYGSNTSTVDGPELMMRNALQAAIADQRDAAMFLNSKKGDMQSFKQKQDALGKMFGLDSVAASSAGNKGTDASTTSTSIDKGGIASVHGGGQIKNVTININNLVNGGVNVHTTTLKEGVTKAKDIVVEGLLTAVNDANLVGN